MPLKSLSPAYKTLGSAFGIPKKVADPFYNSPEWRKVRAYILERDGYRCTIPGCRSTGRVWVDHIVEIKDGGERLDPLNLRTVCHPHHMEKTHAERRKRYNTPTGDEYASRRTG